MLTTAWANKVKTHFPKPNWGDIEGLVTYYKGKTVTETTTVTVKIVVTGRIKAYRPKPR